MSGYIYILSNPSIPGLLKIGHTMDMPEQRLRQLNTTGVPMPFVLEACFLVTKPSALENAVHSALASYRPTDSREFFQLSLSKSLEIILPLVINATATTDADPQGIVPKNHGLSDHELFILQLLVSAGGQTGVTQWRLKDETKLDELDIEICIANLFAKKFISRSRESGNYGAVWCPTPKGTKFLVDNNLIEEWMRQRW
ncbi:MAG: GIY-YIG nuclease family protein [Pseudomonadota bacterium]